MSFRVKQYQIRSKKIVSDSIRLVFLSDLHLTEHGAGNKQLLDGIDNLMPDLVLVGGDMVIGIEDRSTAVAEELLSQIAKKYPVYYAYGNHEQRLKDKTERFGDVFEWYYRRLVSMGIHILENNHAEVQIKGTTLSLYGLSLPLYYYRRFVRQELPLEEIKKRLGRLDMDKLTVLMAHHPRYAKTYFSWGADVTLSGHIHGGVMRIGKQPMISPDFQFFPKYGYGHFSEGEKHLLISGGLGEHTIPFRIFNPKELISIDIFK